MRPAFLFVVDVSPQVNCVLNMMNSVLKMMNSALKMMNSALTMMNSALKMMNSVLKGAEEGPDGAVYRDAQAGTAKTPKMSRNRVVFGLFSAYFGLFGVKTTSLSGHHSRFGTAYSGEYVYIAKATICS